MVVTYFPGPSSATGEDVIEISLHGGEYLQQELLRSLSNQTGVRLATPGEFSLRAFLNNKIDLSRAEGIAETIHAQDAAAHRLGQNHLHGGIPKFLDQIKHDLIQIITVIEAELDFSDQEIASTPARNHLVQIKSIKSRVQTLLDTFYYGQRLMEGFRVPLIGATNTGKSSIFNILSGFDRAIVTEIPGTTRDTIEARLSIAGHTVILIDTAGIRDQHEPIEGLGISRTLDEMEKADIIIVVESPDAPREKINFPPGIPAIRVFNKCDLDFPAAAVVGLYDVVASCKTGAGIASLKQKLAEALLSIRQEADGGLVIASQRQADTLQRFCAVCESAEISINDHVHLEYLASDLRNALSVLGEITGETTPDDILVEIFNTFCIGK